MRRAAQVPPAELRPLQDESAAGLRVVCAFRNEEACLPELLAALLPQLESLPGAEAWFVDDHSSDGGAALVREAAQRNPSIHLLEAEGQGKTAALAQAIRACGGKVLVFLDGDCVPGAGWLRAHARAHEDGARIVLAHQRVIGKGFSPMESLLASAQVAGGAVRGAPPFARGGNWSIRREDWEAVGGYASMAAQGSGDDVFLLHRLLDSAPTCRFLLGDGCQVSTPALERRKRPAQRRRRYSKWRGLSGREALRHGLLAWGLLLGIGLPVAAAATKNGMATLLLLMQLAWLWVIAARALRRFARSLPADAAERKGLRRLPLWPGLVFVYSLWGGLGGYTWKGREARTLSARREST